MIIGIAGKMGCGKDYVCNNLVVPLLKNMNKRFLQVSFADQIKINVMTKDRISFDDVYVSKTTKTRKLLQTEGTEYGRDIFGDDIWINYFDNWLSVYKSRGIDVFICTDVRFKNEIEYIQKCGGIILKVNAFSRNLKRLFKESGGNLNVFKDLQSHRSECDLDDISDDVYDMIIENDQDDSDILEYYTLLYNKIYKHNHVNILHNKTVEY